MTLYVLFQDQWNIRLMIIVGCLNENAELLRNSKTKKRSFPSERKRYIKQRN